MSKKCVESDQKRNEIGIRFDTLDELNQHLEYNKVSKTFCFPNKCRDCGSKSDDETNSPAAKRAKTTGFKIKEELLKMMKKDGKNAKLWEQVEERQVANKKELSDYVEELFCCIICQDIVFKPVTTTCGHNICLPCIDRSFQAEVYSCPSCRYEIGICEMYKKIFLIF